MADATSKGTLTLELHGFLADRLASLGSRRGTRIRVAVALDGLSTVDALLAHLVASDERYGLIFDAHAHSLPEHVEAVLNDRVLDLVGGLNAILKPGDVLGFLPAHAGG